MVVCALLCRRLRRSRPIDRSVKVPGVRLVDVPTTALSAMILSELKSKICCRLAAFFTLRSLKGRRALADLTTVNGFYRIAEGLVGGHQPHAVRSEISLRSKYISWLTWIYVGTCGPMVLALAAVRSKTYFTTVIQCSWNFTGRQP